MSIDHVNFMSARAAAVYSCSSPHVFISIRDVGDQPVVLPENSARVGELFLVCDDLDREIPGRENKLFTRADALAVVKLVVDHPEANTVLVNCMAGVSRSCAVAVAVDELFNNGKLYLNLVDHGVPNGLILRTITALAEPYLNARAYRCAGGRQLDCDDHCLQGCCFSCGDVRVCSLRGNTCPVMDSRYATPDECPATKRAQIAWEQRGDFKLEDL